MQHSFDDDASREPSPETGCTRPELQAALPRWDRLGSAERAKLEGHAAACPWCGPALQLLREAQDWLVASTPARPSGPCPDADDLYDFGRGPGAKPMLTERRAAIEAHLDQCVECEAFVGTLASRPPSPLIVEDDEAGARDPEPLRTAAVGSGHAEAGGHAASRPRRWRALAAAALLAASFFAWSEIQAAGPGTWTEPRFPEPQLMRGADAGHLLYPRDRVLPSEAGPRFGSGLVFEVVPQLGGDSYRIEVARHGGGAFDLGTPVFELAAGTPLLRPSPEQLRLFTPGHYTWEAWARVDGLDFQLGRRDFHVSADAQLDRALAEVADLPLFERVSAELAHLWERGYHADARALARTLPESSARDRFLERTPEL